MTTLLVRLLICACVLTLAGCSSENGSGINDDSDAASDTTVEESTDPASTGEVDEETATTTTESAATTTETTTTAEPTTTEAAPETTATEPEPTEVCGVAVSVSFNESAPRDSMTIVNESTSEVSFTTIEFDLSDSVGGIIFDTVDGGTGVEVFQDFRFEAGDAVLAQDPVAEDGASRLTLDFEEFLAGQSFTFSIDVDDQLANSDLGQIQVTGSEMAEARVVLATGDGDEVVAVFDDADSAQFSSGC